MRCLVGFLCVLPALLAAPVRVSAQGGDGTAQDGEAAAQDPIRGPQRWHPDAYVDPEASKFKVEYVAGDPYAAADERVRKARVGIGVSVLVMGVGAAAGTAIAASSICFDFGGSPCPPSREGAAIAVMATFGAAGLAGMIASGVALHKRKKERDSLRTSQLEKGRRVRFDPVTSRFVF